MLVNKTQELQLVNNCLLVLEFSVSFCQLHNCDVLAELLFIVWTDRLP